MTARWLLPTSADQLEATLQRLTATGGVTSASGGPDLPGSVGGVGALLDVTTEDQVHLAGLRLRPVRRKTVHLDGPRIKRTLLLKVKADAPEKSVQDFERDLTAMPRHITTIRSWALSRVELTATNPAGWTHAWEQEFADLAGLHGDYLQHPYHWTLVDRWFDSEVPGHIVEPALAHTFRHTDGPVLHET